MNKLTMFLLSSAGAVLAPALAFAQSGTFYNSATTFLICHAVTSDTRIYSDVFNPPISHGQLNEVWRAFLKKNYPSAYTDPQSRCGAYELKSRHDFTAGLADAARKEGRTLRQVRSTSGANNVSFYDPDAGDQASTERASNAAGRNLKDPAGGCYFIDNHIKAQHTNYRFIYATFPVVESNPALAQQWLDFSGKSYPEVDLSTASLGCADTNYILKNVELKKRDPRASVIKVHFTPSEAIASDEKSIPDDLKATSRLDERQEAHFTQWIEKGSAEEQAMLSENKTKRKKIYPAQRPQCLRVVDVKQAQGNKRLYFYAIQNICSEPLHAHWCAGERSECRRPKQAWLIQPGDKEGSWMLSQQGPQGVQFYGTACVDTFKGQQVYYDKKSGKCWAWDGN